MKASDVPDVLFLQTVLKVAQPWGLTMRTDVERALPEYPWKVLLAKASRLIKRGLMDGCDCGCRGDYRLLDKGIALINGENK